MTEQNITMDTKITIIPRVDNEGNIILKLTAGQFEEINKGLIALNKRRVVHRNTMAKQRGATETKGCKPELVFSYPVAESSILIPKNTAYNALPRGDNIFLKLEVISEPAAVVPKIPSPRVTDLHNGNLHFNYGNHMSVVRQK